MAALLNLYEKLVLPIKEVCDFVLETSLPLTESEIGFLGFLNDDESHSLSHEKNEVLLSLQAVVIPGERGGIDN